MWLCIQKRYACFFWVLPEPYEDDDYYYPLPADGATIASDWKQTRSRSDGTISGILADWLEDNADTLLTGAIGPNPAGQLSRLVEYLRSRLTNPIHNAV